MMLEKAKNPAFWETVRTSPAYDSLRQELLNFWEENCTEPLTAEKYSLFISYSVTGSRTEYQKPLFVRRRGLCASAVLSLVYPDNERISPLSAISSGRFWRNTSGLRRRICLPLRKTWCITSTCTPPKRPPRFRRSTISSATGFLP